MASPVELKNDAPEGRRIDGTDAETFARRPAAILVLAALQVIEHGRAVVAPADPGAAAVEFGVDREVENGLRVIVVGELIPAELDVAPQGNQALALAQPLQVEPILIQE